MLQTCLFALLLFNNTAPMEVGSRMTTADNISGVPSPAFVLDIKNVSSRDIGSYEIVISFTDPDTGKSMGRHRRTVNSEHADRTALAAGASLADPRPVMLPHSLTGSTPAYSIRVDRVVFTDGTTWSSAAP